MKLELTDEYYEIASEWQYQVALLLKETLKEQKISEENAKEITGNFLFGLAMLQDQGEVKFNGKQYSPRISFHDFQSTLLSIDEDTYTHEYSFSVANEAFNV